MRFLPSLAVIFVASWSVSCSRPPQTTADGNATSAGSGQDRVAGPAIPPPEPAASEPVARVPGAFYAADYLGRWKGVEGMYLVVSEAKTPGLYRLEMQWDLDHKGTFEGAPRGEPEAPGIAFERGGRALMLVRSDGDATGLKHLAGRKDCLTVRLGEGYCRDAAVTPPS